MKTTAVSLLALSLLAAPAQAQVPEWLLPKWTPQWMVWTTAWDTVNKTEYARWPEHHALKAVPRGKLPEGLRLRPPPEYDHAYSGDGVLTITQADSQDEVRRLCPGAAWPKAGAYGCTQHMPWGCWVVIAPDTDMKRVGLTREMIVRHEVAHCNGWSNDHRGALPIEDWALMDD